MKHTIEQIIKMKPANSLLTPIVSDKSFIHIGRRRSVLCLCICGKEKYIDITAFLSGHTISCKCQHAKIASALPTTFKPKYKGNIKILYDKWKNMISRCYDPKNIGFNLYGAKGVRVCDEWRNNYQSFLDWALTHGWEPGLQLDKDIKGNGLLYSPDTCSFVTPIVNYAARKHIHKIIYNNKEEIAVHVAKRLGISSSRFFKRLRKGWNIFDSATKAPVKNELI